MLLKKCWGHLGDVGLLDDGFLGDDDVPTEVRLLADVDWTEPMRWTERPVPPPALPELFSLTMFRHEDNFSSRAPTFLSRSPTMWRALWRADGVRGGFPRFESAATPEPLLDANRLELQKRLVVCAPHH